MPLGGLAAAATAAAMPVNIPQNKYRRQAMETDLRDFHGGYHPGGNRALYPAALHQSAAADRALGHSDRQVHKGAL